MKNYTLTLAVIACCVGLAQAESTDKTGEDVKSASVTSSMSFNPARVLQLSDLKELEGPSITDYDGDGLLDIVSGNYNGNLIFRKNIGTKTKPQFAARKKLSYAGKEIALKHW